MRLAPIILAVIGIWGLLYPQTLLAEEQGGGRWVFAVILALAAFAFWRSLRRGR